MAQTASVSIEFSGTITGRCTAAVGDTGQLGHVAEGCLHQQVDEIQLDVGAQSSADLEQPLLAERQLEPAPPELSAIQEVVLRDALDEDYPSQTVSLRRVTIVPQ